MEANAEHFRLEALREGDPVKETFYKGVEKACQLKVDHLCMEKGLRVEHDEANSIIDNEIENNLSRVWNDLKRGRRRTCSVCPRSLSP